MRVTQRLFPNQPTWRYVSHDKEWMRKCEAKRTEIIEGIKPFLARNDSDTVMKFTMGTGTTGLQREAYCAGWYAIPAIQRLGYTMAELAALPEGQHVTVMKKAIASLLSRINKK